MAFSISVGLTPSEVEFITTVGNRYDCPRNNVVRAMVQAFMAEAGEPIRQAVEGLSVGMGTERTSTYSFYLGAPLFRAFHRWSHDHDILRAQLLRRIIAHTRSVGCRWFEMALFQREDEA